MATETNKKEKADQPTDEKNKVYIIFYWLGIGTLLPWNFFISVNGYWKHKLRTVNATSDEPNEMQSMWQSELSIASMVPNVTFLLLNAAFGHHFKTTPRLFMSLMLVIILFAFTSVMAVVDTDEWQCTFKIITLISVVAININSAIFQGGLLGLAGRFPAKYMSSVFSGQAVGGIFASVTNVLLIAIATGYIWPAFACFVIAVAFLTSALGVFYIVTKSDFFLHYLADTSPTKPVEEKSAETAEFLQDGDVEVRPSFSPKKPNPLVVLGQISLYAVTVFLVFSVTLTCFPGLTTLVSSSTEDKDGDWSKDYFLPVLCFVLFNVGDFVGRLAAEKFQYPKPGLFGMRFVFVCALLRFAFIPLFLSCNIDLKDQNVHVDLIPSDFAYATIMLFFSTSNGYLANICMMSAPQMFPDNAQMSQTAANIMAAILGLGLGCGSLFSYAVLMAFIAINQHQ